MRPNKHVIQICNGKGRKRYINRRNTWKNSPILQWLLSSKHLWASKTLRPRYCSRIEFLDKGKNDIKKNALAERGETKKQSERITVNRNKKKQNKGEIQEIPKKKHRHRLTGSHGCDRAEKIPDEAEAAAAETGFVCRRRRRGFTVIIVRLCYGLFFLCFSHSHSKHTPKEETEAAWTNDLYTTLHCTTLHYTHYI